MRRGYLINVTVLLLLIPLLLLAATYQQTYTYISHSQSQRVLFERQYFSVQTVQDDLQNFVELSFKRAYLTLTEYVIKNSFVTNASESLRELMLLGELKGVPEKNMDGLTLKYWFMNLTYYLGRVGFKISPGNPEEFLNKHIEITVAPLDSFHVAVRVKIKNVTITDASGNIEYSGDIPPNGYIYSVVSIVGFEDPFIVRELNGLYTRIITPCKIPYPGEIYGYYKVSDPEDIDDLVLNWCYIGLPDNESVGMYYPTILERFEGGINPQQHWYYLKLARDFQKALGYNVEMPVGLVTFLVPGDTTDSTLLGALTSVGAGVPSNCTSVAYYFLKCSVDKLDQYCKPSVWESNEYPAFRLDVVTKKLVFGS